MTNQGAQKFRNWGNLREKSGGIIPAIVQPAGRLTLKIPAALIEL
jgi:hypothetical protein